MICPDINLSFQRLHAAIIPASVVTVCLCLAGCGKASSSHPAPPGNNQESVQLTSDFNDEGVASLGYAEPGSVHELLYVLQAPAEADLDNLSIESDCPCVEAIDLPDRVAAGQSALIRLRFTAPDKTLHYMQDLTVNGIRGGEQVKTHLSINARLGLPLECPDDVTLSAEGKADLEVRNEGPEPIKIIYVLSNTPEVKATAPQKAIQPGETGRIQITADQNSGEVKRTLLRIKTTSEKQPELLVYVHPAKG